jgi:hypothetical protein
MKPHRVSSTEQELALHRVSREEEIMLPKVSQINNTETTPFLFFYVYFEGSPPSRRTTLGRYYARGAH